MLLTINKVERYDILALKKVSDILFQCGKDMARKYDLHHWDNSHMKNWLIVAACALKNDIYLVCKANKPIATFQIQKTKGTFRFQKLATLPAFSGCGIGSFCIEEIERLAREYGYSEVVCEVYEKSEHAKNFYEHRGYKIYGTTETLKYRELKLRKGL